MPCIIFQRNNWVSWYFLSVALLSPQSFFIFSVLIPDKLKGRFKEEFLMFKYCWKHRHHWTLGYLFISSYKWTACRVSTLVVFNWLSSLMVTTTLLFSTRTSSLKTLKTSLKQESYTTLEGAIWNFRHINHNLFNIMCFISVCNIYLWYCSVVLKS